MLKPKLVSPGARNDASGHKRPCRPHRWHGVSAPETGRNRCGAANGDRLSATVFQAPSGSTR